MTMISMVLGGFFVGVALETFRRFSLTWKNNIILVFFMEICFWLIQSFVLFYILFRVNGGEIRIYVIVAGFLGFAIYKAMVATLYKRILERLISIIVSIYRFFARMINGIIIIPVKFIIQLLITCLRWVFKGIILIVTFLLTIVFGPIFWIFKKIYHFLPKRVQNILFKLAGLYSTIESITIKVVKFLKFKRR